MSNFDQNLFINKKVSLSEKDKCYTLYLQCKFRASFELMADNFFSIVYKTIRRKIRTTLSGRSWQSPEDEAGSCRGVQANRLQRKFF